jgi:hypothetical protein
MWIDGGGHDFKRHDDEVANAIRDWMASLR